VIVPVSEVTITLKPKPVHCVLIVPNGPTPPSQAIKVNATTSKLVGISNLTPSFEVVFSYVLIITNKRDTTN
jgi:hypothetical protein